MAMTKKLFDKQEGAEIIGFVQNFIDRMNLRVSDIKSEGYWYVSKDGHDGVNLKGLLERIIIDYAFNETEIKKRISKDIPEFEKHLEYEATLITEAKEDVITIATMNDRNTAMELLEQFVIINRQDLKEGN